MAKGPGLVPGPDVFMVNMGTGLKKGSKTRAMVTFSLTSMMSVMVAPSMRVPLSFYTVKYL